MKTRLLALGSLIAVLGATTAVGVYSQANAAPTPSPAPAPRLLQHERHPELRQAMHALENAKTALQSAAHDYHGHRTKAVEAVDRAMGEIRQAFKSERD